MDSQGNFYFGNNGSGNIYKINSPDQLSEGSAVSASPFSNGLSGYNPGDGARCALYSVAASTLNDSTCTDNNAPVTLNVTDNDVDGTHPIVPNSVRLVDPADPGTPATSVTIANQGTFTVNTSTGEVTFEPLVGFTTATVEYTVQDDQGTSSGTATITVSDCAILPSQIGTLTATLSGNQLVVNWSTYSETNSDHFDIEASVDGVNFKKIGTVNTQAPDGNSSIDISYSFSKEVSGGQLLAISLIATCIFLFALNRRNKLFYPLIVIAFLGCLSIQACKKTEALTDETGKVFVRIAKVDKDGHTEYSKVIEVVKK